MHPAAMAELLDRPTLLNMGVNLRRQLLVLNPPRANLGTFRESMGVSTYQNGPMKPITCLHSETNTPTLAAFSAAQSTA